MGVFLESARLGHEVFVPCHSQFFSVLYQRLSLFISFNNHADTEILSGRIAFLNSDGENGKFSNSFSLL